jgi:hypothetical protein
MLALTKIDKGGLCGKALLRVTNDIYEGKFALHAVGL